MKKVMFALGFSILSLLTICCNNLDAVETEKIYPEELKVSSMDYNQFVVSYNQFYNNLQDSKKEIISEYVKSKMESTRTSQQGRVKSQTCNCNPGQSTCSAETWWSSCCICCNAGTQNQHAQQKHGGTLKDSVVVFVRQRRPTNGLWYLWSNCLL
jgi:hypothetical protein